MMGRGLNSIGRLASIITVLFHGKSLEGRRLISLLSALPASPSSFRHVGKCEGTSDRLPSCLPSSAWNGNRGQRFSLVRGQGSFRINSGK